MQVMHTPDKRSSQLTQYKYSVGPTTFYLSPTINSTGHVQSYGMILKSFCRNKSERLCLYRSRSKMQNKYTNGHHEVQLKKMLIQASNTSHHDLHWKGRNPVSRPYSYWGGRSIRKPSSLLAVGHYRLGRVAVV